jgi:hypothetical protein
MKASLIFIKPDHPVNFYRIAEIQNVGLSLFRIIS